MKKVLVLILALTLALSLVACGGEKDGAADMKVAMITDYGDITDQSFNQTTYEACKAFADSNSVDFKYYKPASDSDADRITMIETAINDGYNVIVMPGYAFANAVKATAGEYSDVTFIALDVGHGDLDTYDDNGNLVEEYKVPSNLYCATYQEELCGYMAGYAAVKLGYKHIGFLGGMRVPAVQRYGYGYVQGADAAAKELGLTDVTLKYLYGGAFGPKPEIKAAMDTWCQGDTEIIFAAGGGIYISAAEAAQSTGKKLIGVDTDQKGIIDGANPVVQFVKITFPYMWFITTPYLISNLIGNFNNFGVIYFLTGGSPSSLHYYKGAGKTDLLVTWLYKLTRDSKDFNLAATIGIVIFVISATFSLISYSRSKSLQQEEGFQ